MDFWGIWPVPAGASQDDIRRAINGLASRHEVLRTYYSGGVNRDDAIQYISDAIPDEQIIVRHVDTHDWQQQVNQVLKDESQNYKPDPACQLSWKAAICLTSGKPVCVIFFISHIAVDPFAFSLLKNEFAALINGQTKPDLTTPLQPREFAKMQECQAWRNRDIRATKYWSNIMKKQAHAMPGANSEKFAEMARSGATAHSGILQSRVTYSQLETLSGQYSATIGSLLLSLHVIALSHVSNSPHVSTLLSFSNRTSPQLRSLVCPIATAAPLFVTVPENAPFSGFLVKLHRLSIIAYKNVLHGTDASTDILAEMAHAYATGAVQLSTNFQYHPQLASGLIEDPNWEPSGEISDHELADDHRFHDVPKVYKPGMMMIARINAHNCLDLRYFGAPNWYCQTVSQSMLSFFYLVHRNSDTTVTGLFSEQRDEAN